MSVKTNNVGFGQPIVNLDKVNIAYFGDGGVSDAVRLRLPAEKLITEDEIEGVFIDLRSFMRSGQKEPIMALNFESLWESADSALKKSNLSVFTRPAHPELVGGVKEKYGHVVVADVDDDFHSIPKSHVGYRAVGPGNQDFLERHRLCLRMADLVTTTTMELGYRLQEHPIGVPKEKIRVIPNGWGNSEWWGKKYKRETVNIAWGGTITHRADFALCKDVLIEITGKYGWVKLVIAGDPEIYNMFKSVSEKQKMFLPMVRYEDYPHTLMYYDILLAPLEVTRFNNAKSDIKLVDAGAAKIPFVASEAPVYSGDLWSKGGYLAQGHEQWFNALEELVLYEEMRQGVGKACREAAISRHMNVLSKQWLDAYKETL